MQRSRTALEDRLTFHRNASDAGGSLYGQTAHDASSHKIIRFPTERVKRRTPVPAKPPSEAHRRRLHDWLCHKQFRAHLLGAIQDIELDDGLTGQRLSVWVGEYFVRVCVDGQDYYFDRITGHFDGIGASP
jgi:hypothetical protein